MKELLRAAACYAMKPISPLRFDALAGYAREPRSLYYSEELAYFEHAQERVLGMLFRDRTDDDYGGVILARDRRCRFRCVARVDLLILDICDVGGYVE